MSQRDYAVSAAAVADPTNRYPQAAELAYALLRVAAGLMLIPHVWPKLLAGPTAVAANVMARRQTPEVGAECPNGARSVLCGGRSVMSVPTAIRRIRPRAT
jgi:hypothetical protein